MAMKLMSFAVLVLPLCAQQTVSMHITGKVESAQTSRVDFGKLRKGLREANWIVTSESPTAAKISLAAIVQQAQRYVGVAGVSILMPHSSAAAVQDAQGRNPINTIARVGTGLIGTLASCEGVHVCGAGGSWPHVILGAKLGALVIQTLLPTIPTHALQSITAMMPDPVILDPYGTVSGVIIVELAKRRPEPPVLDEMIEVAIPK